MLYDSQELDCHPLGPFYKGTFFNQNSENCTLFRNSCATVAKYEKKKKKKTVVGPHGIPRSLISVKM